jgi:hypothetical protein
MASPTRAVSVAPSRVMLLQGRPGSGTKTRSLNVEADGTWDCENCAGDGKVSKGKLTAKTNQELQRLLADPALLGEADQTRRYRARCGDVLLSTIITRVGLINSGDCPGEQPPPVTGAILRLLTDATPAEMTHQTSVPAAYQLVGPRLPA